MFTSNILVRRKVWTTYGSLSQGTYKGSGYCEEHFDRQYLIKEWKLFGLCIWRKILDYEDVPVWAGVQLATMGCTDWESQFSNYILKSK